MHTERDGINVHGRVEGWVGEDLHFESAGDDVFAVWGAGGGERIDHTPAHLSTIPLRAH